MSELLYSQANINRNELSLVATPEPIGPRHHPVPFADYVDQVEHSVNNIGFAFNREEYEVDNQGNRFFGAVEIQPLEGEYIPAAERSEYSFILGLRGSHDNSIARGLTLGTRVMVCSNLCFSGDLITINTKQTINITKRLPGMINNAISKLPVMAQQTANQFDRFKMYKMDTNVGDAALVEIFRSGGLVGSQLGRAVNEWYEPSHAEHAEDGYNAWRLLNACTEALKPTGASVNHETLMKRSMICNSFIDRLAA